MWSIDVDGGGLRKIIPLQDGLGPVVSPAFDRIVFNQAASVMT